MSTRFLPGITTTLVGPGGSLWAVVGYAHHRGFWITIRRGMGIAGVRTSRVWATADGRIDWSTQEAL